MVTIPVAAAPGAAKRTGVSAKSVPYHTGCHGIARDALLT